MTIGSVRNYKLLTWLLPLLLLVALRDPVKQQAATMLDRLQTVRTLSERIRSTGVHVRELPEMKNDLERLAHKKMEIASSLLGARSEAGLYELLMLKARENNADIIAITPRQQRAGGDFVELPLAIEAAGGYYDLGRFVGAIENVNRLMRIEGLVMEKDREGRLTAAIDILVYRSADTIANKVPGRGRQEPPFQKREQYLADLEKALSVKIPVSDKLLSFTGGEDPFGAVAAAPVRKGTGVMKAPPKGGASIALKGILWKEPPLAILESLDGRTFIVRKGDTVNGLKIASITRTEVVVSSAQGNYVLHQYEDR
ncbi:MAG: type 4a pilus biogenesis protein PilO [Chitinispirillaceae bacterium]|nr:type 4a pilus biogenesis protein PilO [Chitinispirillaceae bacterium]